MVPQAIMMLDPFPSINKAFSLVVQQKRQLHPVGITADESKVFVAKFVRPFFFNPRSGTGYLPKSFTSKPSDGSTGDTGYCTFCGKYKHTIKTCYKKHGYPLGYKPRS